MNPLVNIKDHIAAYHLIMKGEFDAEIARLEALGKEIEIKLGIITTLDEAKAKVTVVVNAADDLAKVASEKLKAAEDKMSAANALTEASQTIANAARELELKVQNEWDELTKAKDSHTAVVVAATTQLAQAQAAVDASAAQVAAFKEGLEAKATKITAALGVSVVNTD